MGICVPLRGVIESLEKILSFAALVFSVLGVVRGYLGVSPLKRKLASLRETLVSLREAAGDMESEEVSPNAAQRRVQGIQKLVRYYEGQLVADALVPQKIKSAQYLLLSFPLLVGVLGGLSVGVLIGAPGCRKIVGFFMLILTAVIFRIGWKPVLDFLSAINDRKQMCAWSFAEKPEVFEEFRQAEAWTFELPAIKDRLQGLTTISSWNRSTSRKQRSVHSDLHDGFELILLALMVLSALTSLKLMAPVLGASLQGFHVFWFAVTAVTFP